jgi:hypothetical protein
MSSRRHKRRRRWKTNWKEFHAQERRKVSSLYGGVDEDVRRVFFNLTSTMLKGVLADYKDRYGEAACAYARKAYEKWKAGQVQMSGQVSERMLAIVPRHLDFTLKYDLLEKLCRRRPGTYLKVEITGDMTAREALNTALRSIENARSIRLLPDYIAQRLDWLSDNDGKVAQNLLSQVLAHEYEIIVRTVQDELQQLLSVSSDLAGKSVEVQAQRQVFLPGATVQIVLNNSTSTRKEGRARMTNEQPKNESQEPKPTGGNLVPAENPSEGGQLAPIQNPQNLLDEALKRMPPEKQAEVLGKAADEALRLQVKRKENELDLDIVSDKIDQAGRVAREVSQNPNVETSFQTEHRSKQGDTRINVRSKSSFCFVATACFGDDDHPTVVSLRRFRDDVLLASAPGRFFVSGYYWWGPVLATMLSKLPFLMHVVRIVLNVFVNLYRRFEHNRFV